MFVLKKSLFLLFILFFSFNRPSWCISEKNYEKNLKDKVLPWAKLGVIKKFKGMKGINLSYVCYKKIGASETIILSNGRTESIPKYFEVAYDLYFSGLKVNVCIMDHRGQGLSQRILKDQRKGHVDQFSYYVNDFIKFLDTLKKEGLSNKFYIWAQSMGAGIAVRASQRRPDLVSGLVILSPLMGMYTKPLPNWVVYSMATVMTWFNMGERFIPGETYYIPDPTLKGFKLNKNIRSLKRWNMTESIFSYPEKKWNQKPLGGATVRWLREALKISRVITKNAHKILAPTLLFQAGDDHNVIPENHVSTCQKAKDCKIFSFQNEK